MRVPLTKSSVVKKKVCVTVLLISIIMCLIISPMGRPKVVAKLIDAFLNNLGFLMS